MRLKSNPPKKNFKHVGAHGNKLRRKQNMDCTNLSLSSLDDISFYPNIIHLDVSNNLIMNAKQFLKILNTESIRSIKVHNNPLCTKINYRYPFIVMFPQIEDIDGVTFQKQSQDTKIKLIQSQSGLGNRIIQFLHWKSQFFKELDQMDSSQDQSNLSTTIEFQNLMVQRLTDCYDIINECAKKAQYYWKNIALWNCLTKVAPSECQQIDSKNYAQIRTFWVEEIMKFAAKSPEKHHWLNLLLEQLFLNQETHEESFIQNPADVAKLVEQYLVSELRASNFSSRHIYKTKEDINSVQTNDTYCQQVSCFHFCLEQDYVDVVFQAMQFHMVQFMEKIDLRRKFVRGKREILEACDLASKLNDRNIIEITHQERSDIRIQDSLDRILQTCEQNHRVISQQDHHQTAICPQISKEFTFKGQLCKQTLRYNSQQSNKCLRTVQQVQKDKINCLNNSFIVERLFSIFEKVLLKIAFNKVNRYRRSKFTNRNQSPQTSISKIFAILANVNKRSMRILFKKLNLIYTLPLNLNPPSRKRIVQIALTQRRQKALLMLVRRKHLQSQVQMKIAFSKWLICVSCAKIRQAILFRNAQEIILPRSSKTILSDYQRIVKRYKFK